MKHFFLSLLILALVRISCFASGFAYADKVNFVTRPFIFSPADAMRAYEGEWEGNQNTFLPDGEVLGIFLVSQTYKRSSDGMDCYMQAYSSGKKIADKRFKLVAEGKYLVLLTEGKAGEYIPSYIGEMMDGQVVWNAYYPFMLPDIQTDSFFGVNDFAKIRVEGFQYAFLPTLKFKGVLRTTGNFSKKKAAKLEQPPMRLMLDKNYFMK